MVTESPILPRKADVLECQIQRWYPRFRSVTVRTEILELPEGFRGYLLSDGVFLPKNSQVLASLGDGVGEWETINDDYQPFEESDSDDDDNQEKRDGEEDNSEPPSFPEFEVAVNEAIARLGGSVLPKLNWSAPKDASWLLPSRSLKCTSAEEVFLLLKSSDSIVHDLCHALDSCRPERCSRDTALGSGKSKGSSSGGSSGIGTAAEHVMRAVAVAGMTDCRAGKEEDGWKADVRREDDGGRITATQRTENGYAATAAASCKDERVIEKDRDSNGLMADGCEGASETAEDGAAATDAATDGGARVVGREVGGSVGAKQSVALEGVRFVLALRKWFDWRPEREFRCFVVAGRLRGVSQRDVTGFFPTLLDERESLKALILAFFEAHVQQRATLCSYTFDVYVARNGSVRLVDFNPFGGSTLPLLFTWTELLALHSEREGVELLDGQQQASVAAPPDACTEQQITADHNSCTSDGAALTSGVQQDSCCHRHCGSSSVQTSDGVEMRIVESQGMIQPCLGAVSGTPFELHDRSEGSAWEEMMERLQREGQL